MGLVEGYDAINLPLAYPELRAELERDLKLICTGERDPKIVLEEQIKKYREAYKVIAEKITEMDSKLAIRFETAPVDMQGVPAMQQTIEEVFKCPRCNLVNMAIRSKKDNAGYYMTCMNKPACNHVIWLTDVIKEIKVQDAECPKCRAGVKTVKIKFKRMNILSMLTTANVTDDNYYVSCLRCDSILQTILDIDENSLRQSNTTINSTANILNGSNSNRNTAPSANSTRTANPIQPNNIQRRNEWNAPALPPPPRPPAARPNANNFNNIPNSDGSGTANNRSFGNDENLCCPHCQQPAKKYVFMRTSNAFHLNYLKQFSADLL